MNIKAITFLSLLTLSTLSTPAFSQTKEIDISKVPTINNRDWRTPSSFSPPWSTPVLVNDEFDGTYLAVYDHNFQIDGGFMGMGGTGEHGITSEWSPHKIRVYHYVKTSGGDTIKEVSSISIKVGGKVFKPVGSKGNFAVTPELIYALKTAPLEVAVMRVEYGDSGIQVTNDIGVGTVTAWRTVFQNAKDPSQASSGKSKINEPATASSNDKPKTTQAISASNQKSKAKLKRKY